jgi:hypothetical protein
MGSKIENGPKWELQERLAERELGLRLIVKEKIQKDRKRFGGT